MQPTPPPAAATELQLEYRSDGVALVKLNRPAKRNAMHLAMWHQLATIVLGLGRDPKVRCLVLTGTADTFCAGADISEFAAVRSGTDLGGTYDAAVDAAAHAIAHCPKPTIAAISGACVGGGVAIAVACDFRCANVTAYFAVPAARLGVVYGVLETQLLVQAVGPAKAKEILFSGRKFDADAAAQMGLVTHLVDAAETPLNGALALAASFTLSAPRTIAGAKLIIAAFGDAALDEHAAAIQAALDGSLTSQDYQEGIAAFKAKRSPRFTGA
jgi:enoyl-CoA hydratase/carnithine racemase